MCVFCVSVTDACAVPGKSSSAVLQFMKYRELKETERKTFSKSKKKSNKPVKVSLIFVEVNEVVRQNSIIICVPSYLNDDPDFCWDHEEDQEWLEAHERKKPTSTC